MTEYEYIMKSMMMLSRGTIFQKRKIQYIMDKYDDYNKCLEQIKMFIDNETSNMTKSLQTS